MNCMIRWDRGCTGGEGKKMETICDIMYIHIYSF